MSIDPYLSSIFPQERMGLQSAKHTASMPVSQYRHSYRSYSLLLLFLLGKIGRVDIINSYFHDITGEGHEVKSRAMETNILCNTIGPFFTFVTLYLPEVVD
jgi:hypothetical protein